MQDWSLEIDHDVIENTKEEREIAPGPLQISGKIVLTAWHSPPGKYRPAIQRAVAPGLSMLFPMERPRYASLEPLPMKLRDWRQSEDGGRKEGADCSVWFLGHGCIRLEMDMQPYTGQPGKLMWSGLQLPSRQPYKHTIENKRWESSQADKGLKFTLDTNSDFDD